MESSNLININVNICDRPYRMKVKPEEEEHVRKAAKMINERVKELQGKYAAKDKQDYIAMGALMFLVERLTQKDQSLSKDNRLTNKVVELEKRLDQVLSVS